MIALFIDSVHKTVTPQHIYSLADMQEAVGGYIEIACELETGDIVYVDEKGLLKPCDNFFFIDDGFGGHPFAGNALVVGPVDANGDHQDCLLAASDLEKRIGWLDRIEVLQMLDESRAYDRNNGYGRLN